MRHFVSNRLPQWHPRRLTAALVLALVLVGLTAPTASAATLAVTSTADSGAGSLRQAIADAAAGDTITFDLSGCPCTITLASELAISKNLTITGPGANQVVISGNNATRVFEVLSGAAVAVDGLVISGARPASGNNGGGILNNGTLVVSNSTFSGNNGGSFGGGIYNLGGTATVSNSTFSGNSASFGGGIVNDGGTLSVSNSTFSGNSAGIGGGLYSRNGSGSATVSSSTFSGNSASSRGGGVFILSGTVTVNNSIVAGNTASSDREMGSSGPATSGGYNLFGFNSNAGLSNVATAGTDVVPTADLGAVLDSTLRSNGGPTQTLALVAGSPAIDVGSTTLGADQRGIARPQGPADDIGAFEFVPAVVDTTPPVITPTVSGTLGNDGWYTSDVGVTWSVTDPTSSITSSTGCDPSSVTTDTAGVTLTCTATSGGGSATRDVTVKRDTAGPTLSITGGPAEAGSYPAGAVPAAPTCTATDTLSGPAGQACTISGYSTATGPHTLTFTATDVAGNTTTLTRTYTVLAPVPGAITATSGGGQSAAAGSVFTAPVVATVTDTVSAPLPGAPVTFTVTAGSVTFPGGAKTAQVNTDASGRATSPAITAGTSTGPATITASTPGVAGTASFTETVTAARADLSAAVSAPASVAKGATFPVVLVISNAGPSPASTIGSAITLPSGLTITNGGGGAVAGNKQSVGFLTASLAPGASVTYTITVKATAKGTRAIVGGVLSVRTSDPRPANNLGTARTTVA